MSRMSKEAHEALVERALAWLHEQTPRTEEWEFVESILHKAVEYEYGADFVHTNAPGHRELTHVCYCLVCHGYRRERGIVLERE